MKILTLGNQTQVKEAKLKFSSTHEILVVDSHDQVLELVQEADVIFDFNNEEHNTGLIPGIFVKPIFINTVFTTLGAYLKNHTHLINPDAVFGFCGLHTFLNRNILEVSISNQNSEQVLKTVCGQLKTDYVIVKDQVGFITPRVIGMIINEAYITAEEGIANASDIDLAMKLGTNYPYGPFEWAKRIGINEVIKLMDVTYQETHDTRYQICNSLRNANLQ